MASALEISANARRCYDSLVVIAVCSVVVDSNPN